MDRRVPNAERKHKLNREIMAPQVRLNGVENEPLGIVPLMEALRMAGDLDVGLIVRLLSLIRSARPDLVHLHSRIGADVMGGIACRLTGVPVVHSRRQDNPESRVAVALKYRLHDRVIAMLAARLEANRERAAD